MKQRVFTYLCILASSALFAQSKLVRSGLFDANGVETGYRETVVRFENIKGVMDMVGGKASEYYITKEAKVVGRDSVYSSENEMDCESEGFIRFNDKAKNTGMFNSSGTIVIPANYNYLGRVINGLVVARKGATLEYADSDKEFAMW